MAVCRIQVSLINGKREVIRTVVSVNDDIRDDNNGFHNRQDNEGHMKYIRWKGRARFGMFVASMKQYSKARVYSNLEAKIDK